LHYQSGTPVRSVGKKVLILLFFIISTCHHTQESFKLSREIFGIENEMPSGNNESDKNKTQRIMRKTTHDYNNDATGAIPQTLDKNPSHRLL
jgi:hypothetical protein